MPAAVTPKVILLPTKAIWFCGCTVIVGGNRTVSTATWLVTEPYWLATTTS